MRFKLFLKDMTNDRSVFDPNLAYMWVVGDCVFQPRYRGSTLKRRRWNVRSSFGEFWGWYPLSSSNDCWMHISTISPLFSAHPSVIPGNPELILDVHQPIHNSSVFHILFHHFSIDDSQLIGIVVFHGRLSHDFPMVSTRIPTGPSVQERLVKAAQIDLEETGDVEEV